LRLPSQLPDTEDPRLSSRRLSDFRENLQLSSAVLNRNEPEEEEKKSERRERISSKEVRRDKRKIQHKYESDEHEERKSKEFSARNQTAKWQKNTEEHKYRYRQRTRFSTKNLNSVVDSEQESPPKKKKVTINEEVIEGSGDNVETESIGSD
jgi:hypothetical protein